MAKTTLSLSTESMVAIFFHMTKILVYMSETTSVTPPINTESTESLRPSVPEQDAQAEQQKLVKELIGEHGAMYIKGSYQFNPQTGDRVIPPETFKSGILSISETSNPAELQQYIAQKKAEQSGKDAVVQARELLSNSLLLPDEVEGLTQELTQTTTLEATAALTTRVNELKTNLQNRDKEAVEKAKLVKRETETRGRARGVYDTFTAAYQALPDNETPEELSALVISREQAAIDKRMTISVHSNASEKDDSYALQILDLNRDKPYNADEFLVPLVKSLGLEGVDTEKVKAAVQRVRPEPRKEAPGYFWGVTDSDQNIGQGDARYRCVVDTDKWGKTNVYIPRPDGQTYVFLSFNAPKQGEPLALTSARIDSRSWIVNDWRGGIVESEMRKLMPEPQQSQ